MAATGSPVALAEELLALVKTIYQPALGENPSSQSGYDAKHRIAKLCDDLRRDIIGPAEYTVLLAESCQESSALRVASDLAVADIIGDKTTSLSEISEKTGINKNYLSVIMNCLLGHGYFVEVDGSGSQSYQNNEMSFVLHSGHDENLRDAIGFACDEGFKSASYLLEAATASVTVDTNDGMQKSVPAANIAFGFKESIFEWMASPEESWRGQRMGKAMQQLHRMANGTIVSDFPWCELTSPIVDIGGGIGALEIALVHKFPENIPDFIIFDISETSENAKKVWSTQPPSAQARVSFISGDFLASTLEDTRIPQGQPTYLIRHVLHDWTDEQVVEILTNVRNAMLAKTSAGSTPKLFVCEMLLQPKSSRFVRTTSMQLLSLNNGMTRTEGEMLHLVKLAGFAIVDVHSMRAADTIIEAAPLE